MTSVLRLALIAALLAPAVFTILTPVPHAEALSPINQPGGQKVYWTEFGADKIRRADFDGAHLEDVNTGLAGPGAFALDVGSGLQYWADVDSSTIKRGPMEGTTISGLDAPETIVGSVAAAGLALDTMGQKIYWTQGSTVRRANTDGTSQQTIVTGQGCPLGIAIDELAEAPKVYWSDPCLDTIKRANLDGSAVATLVSTGLDGPGGVAVDPYAGKLYWVDTTLNTVGKANLDGTSQQTILSSLGGPEDIAVDPVGGRIYWTEFSTSKVRSADHDGTDPADIAPTGSVPFGIDIDIYTPEIGIVDIAIDAAAGKMYYTDFGTKVVDGERWGRIMRANLDGTNRVELVGKRDPSIFPIGIDLDLQAGKMYWTTRDGGDLHRANLDGTVQEDLNPAGSRDPCMFPSVAVDTVNDRLYYADAIHGHIHRSNLDGTGEVVLVTGAEFPQDIALDVAGDRMYWTETDGAETRIMRSTLTGGSITELVTIPDPTPDGIALALDLLGGNMYVTFPTPSPDGAILRYNLDGTGEQTILSGLNNPRNLTLGPTIGGGAGSEADGLRGRDRSFGLPTPSFYPSPLRMTTEGVGEAAGPTSKVYWTDDDGLHRANLNGTSQELLVASDSDGDGCPNVREQQTAAGSQTSGGLRDDQNPYDYFNPSGDGQNRIEDMLAVRDAYFEDDNDANPGLPPYAAAYNPATDRDNDAASPNAWNTGAPDGLQRVQDILHMLNQYFHDCA